MRLRSSKPPMIQDDTGMLVPLWTPWHGDKEDVPPEIAARITGVLEVRRPLGEQVLWGSGTSLLLIVLAIGAVVLGGRFLPFWTIVLPPIALGFAMSALHWRITMRRSARDIRATLIAARICPSCAYDLNGSRAAADRLHCCPECRAEWRLPEAGIQVPGDQPTWVRGRQSRLIGDAGLGWLLERRSFSGLDALGRAVEYVFPQPRRRPPTHWFTIPTADREAIENELRTLGRGRRSAIAAAAIFITALSAAGLSLRLSNGRALDVMALFHIFWPLFMIGLAVDHFRYPRLGDKSSIAKILLKWRRCPSCAGDLSPAVEDSDGITECPHCAAAWHVPPPPVSDPSRTIVYAPRRD